MSVARLETKSLGRLGYWDLLGNSWTDQRHKYCFVCQMRQDALAQRVREMTVGLPLSVVWPQPGEHSKDNELMNSLARQMDKNALVLAQQHLDDFLDDYLDDQGKAEQPARWSLLCSHLARRLHLDEGTMARGMWLLIDRVQKMSEPTEGYERLLDHIGDSMPPSVDEIHRQSHLCFFTGHPIEKATLDLMHFESSCPCPSGVICRSWDTYMPR